DKRFGFDLAAYANVFRIVGVVRDAKYGQPREPARPMAFVPLAQYVTAYQEAPMRMLELNSHFISSATLVTRSDPGALEPVLRKTFAEVDPNLTIVSVRTMQEQVAMNFDQERTVASLAGLFGLVALVLPQLGFTESRRTPWPSGQVRSVCGWRSERAKKKYCNWCCAARSKESGSDCCSGFH